jgi:O-antigen ligase/polysaccharide polymerase Wzy-like membrane protein
MLLSKEARYIILSYVLLIGLTLFLTGYFWQEKTTRLQTLYYILVVSPIFISIIHQVKSYQFNTVFLIFFLLVTYSAISVFWSDNISIENAFRQWKKVILLVSLFFSISYVGKKFPNYENNILNVMLFFAVILASYNIYDLLTTVGLAGRIQGHGLLDNANITAEVFGVMFLFSFMQFLKSEQKIKILIYLLIATVIFIEMLFNKSRGQQLALFVGVLLVICFVPRDKLKRLIPIALLGMVVLAVMLYFTNILEMVFDRNLTFDCRSTIWTELWASAMQTPIFGRGSGASAGYTAYCLKYPTEPFIGTHSVYMGVFLYQGVVGVLLALLLTGYSVAVAYKSIYQHDAFWGIIIIYGFIALIPNGDSLVSRPSEVWMLFWIPVAFIASRQKNAVPRAEN